MLALFLLHSPLSKAAWQPILPLSPGSSTGPILSCRSDGSNSVNGKQDEWYPVPRVYEARWNGGLGEESAAGTHPPLGPY